jgi:Acylphosphatases
MVRKHYVFHGRVQGVGFRITAYQKAIQFHLTGWIRNLSDGTVEACFQGNKEAIEDLIRYMQTIRYIKIEKMEIEEISVLNDEKSFEMKY